MTKLLEEALARVRTVSDDDTGAALEQPGAFATDRDMAELVARHGA